MFYLSSLLSTSMLHSSSTFDLLPRLSARVLTTATLKVSKFLLVMFKLDRWINMLVFTFRIEFENHFKTPVWSFSSALGITSQSCIADHIDHDNLYYVSIFWTFLMICCFGFQCSVVSEVKVLILAIKESSVHRAI